MPGGKIATSLHSWLSLHRIGGSPSWLTTWSGVNLSCSLTATVSGWFTTFFLLVFLLLLPLLLLLPSVKGHGIDKYYCKQIAEGHFTFQFITLKQWVLIRWTILQNRERITIYLHRPKLVCRRLRNRVSGTQTLVCIRILTEQYWMEEFARTQNNGFKPCKKALLISNKLKRHRHLHDLSKGT